MKKHIFYILFIFIISCKGNKTNHIVHFADVESLVGEKVETINPDKLVEMDVNDSLLIIVNNEGKYIFQIYNTNTDSLIIEAVNKGKGPNEIYAPTLACHSSRIQKSRLDVFDVERRKISKVDFDEMLKSRDLDEEGLDLSQKRLPKNLGHVRKVYYQDDSVIYYKKYEEGRFSIYDVNKSKIKTVPYITPELRSQVSWGNDDVVYNSEVEINISHNTIVTAPLFVGQLDFFSLKGKYLYTAKFENPKELDKKSSQVKPPKMYVYDIKSNADYIYALNVNFQPNEINIELNTKKINSELLLFDWNGRPIKKYILDRCIGYFAIDFKKNCIYGYAPYEHDFAIIKYQL